MNPVSEKEIIELLVKLFDVKSVIEDETKIFTNISHAELNKAIEYWIDQSKGIFGEPVLLYQTQSLRDAGVDVSMNLVSSSINFGFQVKSHGDIEETQFSKNVKAQIQDSQKHKLKKLIIGLAGNLTDKKQAERVRGLISEIKQQDTNYVIVIPPEKLVTIYNAYVEKKHPLQHVMFEISDAIKIATGLSKSLSNEKRDVSVNVNIKYKHDIDKEKYQKTATISLKLKKEDLEFIDNFEKLHQTGGSISLTEEQLGGVKIYDKGKLVNKFEKGTLEIIPEYRDPLTIITLSESGQKLSKLENMTLVKRHLGGKVVCELDDERQRALKLTIILVPQKELTMNFGFEFVNNDVEQLQQAIDFVESLKTAKKINFVNQQMGVDDKINIPSQLIIPKISDLFLKMNKALFTIQKYTGHRYKFPEKLEQNEINDIFEVVHLLEKKKVKSNGVQFRFQKNDASKLLELYQKDKLEGTLGTEKKFNILGKEVNFDIQLNISKFKVKDFKKKIDELKTISEQDAISIELKAIDDSLNTDVKFKN